MTARASPVIRVISSYALPPKISLRFRLLREGVVTDQPKILRLFRGWGEVSKLELSFVAEDGEFTSTESVAQSVMLDQGEWLVAGLDNTLPRRTKAVYMSFYESDLYLFDISSGGGSAGGTLGSANALIRVDGLPRNRNVVFLELPPDGEWRLAGYGPTPNGQGRIDVRSVGSAIYGMAVDDFGIEFVPLLPVQIGQRVRPTRFVGWLYEITESGQLPDVEPSWWTMDGGNATRVLGTARAIAVRYYRPLAHGPVSIEVP